MRAVRLALIALELVVAVNALGGGLYGLAGAPGLPRELLRGSPFSTPLGPGLILLVAVSGSMWLAALLLLRRHRLGPWASLAAGLVLMAWIGVQIGMIGLTSFLQPAMLVLGALVAGLAAALLRRGAPA